MRTTTSRTPRILTARAVEVALRRYSEARATGRRVAWSREAAGVSQAELAAYVGVSAATIRRVEHGERALTPGECAATARALGCSIATLTTPAVSLTRSNGNGRAA
jgi:transcriptional regulator with XRE-family HTH domain